jgi:hypothetical protein
MIIMKFIKGMALAACCAVSAQAYAAPIVLSGNYIRIGISDFGTFGSNGNADPAFVHDPSGTGTFDSDFDYIAPGTPHDGFSLVSSQFGFTANDNNFGSGFGSGSPTLLTGAAANGFANAASWTGQNAFARITNSYFFNAGDERVLITTTITALSDLTNLAFARSVDPDSDSRSFGTSSSNNQRGNSLFGVNDFVGSAGSVSGRTLAIVNVDDAGFEHTTQINGSCCSNINPYTVLANGGDDRGLSSVGDHGLNMAYRIGTLAAGSSATFSYAYAVGARIEDTGGAPVVPEPGTWMLMLTGFGTMGAVMRRQRRRGHAIVAA